eukprot:1491214-Pyramimonas_sp.AAC.1
MAPSSLTWGRVSARYPRTVSAGRHRQCTHAAARARSPCEMTGLLRASLRRAASAGRPWAFDFPA